MRRWALVTSRFPASNPPVHRPRPRAEHPEAVGEPAVGLSTHGGEG